MGACLIPLGAGRAPIALQLPLCTEKDMDTEGALSSFSDPRASAPACFAVSLHLKAFDTEQESLKA